MRDELRAPVRGDMGWHTMFQEYMGKEQLAVNYYQYRSVSLRCWKLFNEIHRNGFPWAWGDWQLFEEAIQFVSVCLGVCTYCAGSDVLFDHLSKSGPMIQVADQVNGFVMAKVSCHWVVMVIAD